MNEVQPKCGMGMLLPLMLIFGVASVVIGWKTKQRLLGFLLGLFWGPVGLAILAAIMRVQKSSSSADKTKPGGMTA